MSKDYPRHIERLLTESLDFVKAGNLNDAVPKLIIAVGYQQDVIRDLRASIASIQQRQESEASYQREQNEQ